jgi:hypothetical protein
MEYNFSVTRRMLTLFLLCSCLLVACVFFLGFEFGKKISVKPENGLRDLKTEINQKIQQEAQSVSAVKGLVETPGPVVDKKLP